MSNIAFSGLRGYNRIVPQNVLLGRFVEQSLNPLLFPFLYAKRLENPAFILPRYSSHSLRRNGASSAFLQQAQTSVVATTLYQGPSTQGRLSSLRHDYGSSVYYHGWSSENQQDRNPPIQWSIPFSVGASSLSRPIHASAIPQTVSSQNYPSTCCLARSASGQVVCSTQTQNLAGLRFRFRGPNHLWQTSICPSRLQSQKTGQTLLSPDSMLRGPSSGVLAWFSTSWKLRCCYRGRAFYQSLSLQSSRDHCPVSHPISGGFWAFQQKSGRTSRPRRLWLCDCGQTLPHDQIPGFGMPFPKTQKRLGDSRISISTSSLEGFPPLYCCSTSHPRRSCGGQTTHPLQVQKICLPCLGHQFEDSSLESLEILRPEGHHRKECPGTPLRLSSGQDSNRRLGSQCSFLSHAAVGLQYCPLVQKAVSSQRVSLCYTGYDPHRFLGLTSQVDQERKSKCSGTPSRLPLPRAVRKCSQKNRQTQDLEKFMNLQIIGSRKSSIFKETSVKNYLLTHN